ncbi:helix-turn-helix domain-containing protein [Actinotignum urinale]|uniref:helix-turn-helix domain-containing protein n=1 Tax=Actinotignum urinale TaxID=190146 RepID=UPI002A813688|nr:helix-turn-helix domain-containing protein [Actinotignum urinale]MDY5151351.1 helix-turn-helix domain-containing protein [Actinotignum urinale]
MIEWDIDAYIKTAWDIDRLVDYFDAYGGAVTDGRDGYRATFSIEADTLDGAYSETCTVVATAGELLSVAIAPAEWVEYDILHGKIPELVSVPQAANMMEISQQAVHKRIKAGTLPATKVGGTWVLSLGTVLALALK